MTTIQAASSAWLDSVGSARSPKTRESYECALKFFVATLKNNGMPAHKTDVSDLNERSIAWLADDLKSLSPASEQMYLTAIRQFFMFLMAEEMTLINMEKVKAIIKMRARLPGERYPQFASDEIELFLERVDKMPITKDGVQRLIDLRDRAFLLLLPDTGFRVHEACKLLRGEVDWEKGRAVIIGKGNRQAVVRFTTRNIKTLRQYHNARATLDGATGLPLTSLPVFARHDAGAGKKIKAMSTDTGRNIVKDRLVQLLTVEERVRITPHSFRHYFVSEIYKSSHDLVLAQELARHKNIATTKKYTHLSDEKLDKGYYDVFEKRK